MEAVVPLHSASQYLYNTAPESSQISLGGQDMAAPLPHTTRYEAFIMQLLVKALIIIW